MPESTHRCYQLDFSLQSRVSGIVEYNAYSLTMKIENEQGRLQSALTDL